MMLCRKSEMAKKLLQREDTLLFHARQERARALHFAGKEKGFCK